MLSICNLVVSLAVGATTAAAAALPFPMPAALGGGIADEKIRPGDFYLKTTVTEGTKAFDGLYVSSFHTGAGESAAIVTTNMTIAAPFFINSTYLNYDVETASGPIPYTMGLDTSTPYNSTAPDDYDFVELSVSQHTPGFSIEKDTLTYAGTLPYKTFVVCHVNGIAPYQSVGPENELLWRPKKTKACEGGCADVILKAVYIP